MAEAGAIIAALFVGGLLDVFAIWFESSGAVVSDVGGLLGLDSVYILCET